MIQAGDIYTIEIPEDEFLSLTKYLRMEKYPNTTWHRTESGFLFMSGAPGHIVAELHEAHQRAKQLNLFADAAGD